MSEYNPFDIAPPVPHAQEPKPAEKPAPTTEAEAPPGQIYYASPPEARAPRPADPAPPGRAPLAGQPASIGAPMPAPQYGGPAGSAPMPTLPYGNPAASPMPPPAYASPGGSLMPQAYGAPPVPLEPMPDPNVRYDLAGNPLPAAPSMGGGSSVAPPPGMNPGGAVRYDLAGNPLPMQAAPAAPPAAPGGPYGYSPGPGGPPPAYAQPSYESYSAPQNAFRPSTNTGPMVPAGMEEAMTNGANWMIGIVLLTLASIWLNKLTFPFMMPYISYAAISGVIDMAMLMGHALGGYTVSAVLASVGLLPLALLAVLGYKRQAWVFMIAMIIYGIDIPVTIVTWAINFSLWGIILGTAWHSFVFQRMFAAFTAAREINATMAGQRR